MPCVHLQQLYELCDKQTLKLSSSDLIHIVCHQCGKQEVCPSTLSEHYPEEDAASLSDVQPSHEPPVA